MICSACRRIGCSRSTSPRCRRSRRIRWRGTSADRRRTRDPRPDLVRAPCAQDLPGRINLTHTSSDGEVTVSFHDGLLPALREVTEALDPPWLRSAFVDDAGIVAFDDHHDVAFKVETHNHPSALSRSVARTPVSVVVRDVIGVSARPIACTDVLCFGPADLPDDELPPECCIPAVFATASWPASVDYGNKLGLPTVNGSVLYDPGYVGNPLVYCGALGILPHGFTRPSRRSAIASSASVDGSVAMVSTAPRSRRPVWTPPRSTMSAPPCRSVTRSPKRA